MKSDINILVSSGSCGISLGSEDIYKKLKAIIQSNNIKNIKLSRTGCIGLCYCEPNVILFNNKEEKIYVNVKPEDVNNIIFSNLSNNNTKEPKYIERQWYYPETEKNTKNFNQSRVVLKNIGNINPENIYDYINASGYKALKKALFNLEPQNIISIIKKSGLRGRSGNGFSTGIKWELISKQQSNIKYIICNADEGNPGSFVDRIIMEGDPHSIIEAMIIAGYAVGSNYGYIYLRKEYPLAMHKLKIAIKQAKKLNFLGENILKTNYNFNIKIIEGAGSFVCGEETALIKSIESQRGIPIKRPPYPIEKGLNNKPTVINNVETLANICPILRMGYEKYKQLGTKLSTGTKIYSLTNGIKKSGTIEVPMGIKLEKVIYEIGDGTYKNTKINAIQIGGPSGIFIHEKFLKEISLDYESLTKFGGLIGKGGIIIITKNDNLIKIVKSFMEFAVEESCGKCTPCRIGTKHILKILDKIISKKGKIEDIELIKKLSLTIKNTSFCGFGLSVTNNVLSSIEYFKNDCIEYIQK